MGKGKKKARGKGKKRDDKKTNDIANASGDGNDEILDPPPQLRGPTPEQCERAREAAANRTEDPLKNWVRTNQEECPICMLPFPPRGGVNSTIYWYCCGKTICGGCAFGASKAQRKSGGDLEMAFKKLMICPFCRSNMSNYPTEKSQAKQEMKRANAGQPDSMYRVADYYFRGMMGVQQDKTKGWKWFHLALEAGSGQAAWEIGTCYFYGDGVDHDVEKALEYYQMAVELGFEGAYPNIGFVLMERGEIEKGMLNFRKAVMCGISYDGFFDELRRGFKNGFITKEEYAFTLRTHQTAVDETKSEERELYKKCQTKFPTQFGLLSQRGVRL